MSTLVKFSTSYHICNELNFISPKICKYESYLDEYAFWSIIHLKCFSNFAAIINSNPG